MSDSTPGPARSGSPTSTSGANSGSSGSAAAAAAAAAGPSRPVYAPATAQDVLLCALRDDLYRKTIGHVRVPSLPSMCSCGAQSVEQVLAVLVGPSLAAAVRPEVGVVGDLLYYGASTLVGATTLGEEFVQMFRATRVVHNGRPMIARLSFRTRVGVVAGQVLTHYVLARYQEGITLLQAVVDDRQAALTFDGCPRFMITVRELVHALLRKLLGALIAVRDRLTTTTAAVSKIAAALPAVAWVVQRLHLAAFYADGMFYYLAMRLFGVVFVLTRPAASGLPSMSGLKWMVLLQLGLEILSRGGRWLRSAAAPDAEGAGSEKVATLGSHEPHVDTSGSANCVLCLSRMEVPTATICGHVFCWECVYQWVNQQHACPLCRAPCTAASLLCLQNYAP